MIKPRVIARLDIKSENLIKGIHLEGLSKIGNPNEYAFKYNGGKKRDWGEFLEKKEKSKKGYHSDTDISDDFDDDLFPPLPLEEGTELPSSLCFSAKQIVVLVGAAIHKRKKIWRKPIEILIFFSSSYTFVFASSSRLLL